MQKTARGVPAAAHTQGMVEQVLVEIGDDRLGVAYGGDAPDGVAGALPHELAGRLLDGLAYNLRQKGLVDAVRPRDQDQHGLVRDDGPKDQRLHDLGDGATHGGGRICRRPGALRHLPHLGRRPQTAQLLGHPRRGAAQPFRVMARGALDVVGDLAFVAVACRGGPSRLEHEDGPAGRRGFVLRALRHHEHLSLLQHHGAFAASRIPQGNVEPALEHEEKLVGVLVDVPDVLALGVGDTDVVVVDVPHDAGTVNVGERRQSISEVDGPILSGTAGRSTGHVYTGAPAAVQAIWPGPSPSGPA